MFILTYKHACVTRFLESRKASDEELQIAKNGTLLGNKCSLANNVWIKCFQVLSYMCVCIHGYA